MMVNIDWINSAFINKSEIARELGISPQGLNAKIIGTLDSLDKRANGNKFSLSDYEKLDSIRLKIIEILNS